MNTTIDLVEAKAYLRVDHDEDNNNIMFLLSAAEKYIRDLCKPFVDAEGVNVNLPVDLQQAVLLLCSHWYDNRGVLGKSGFLSEVPYAVSCLVANHRDWPGGTDE